jgi:hypothetical protein
MSIATPNEFFLQKKSLLKQCLNLSEELISNLEEWESFDDILKKREDVIEQIKELEEAKGKNIALGLSSEMKTELDQTLNLILELDKKTTELMRKEQKEIMASLKNNAQEQRVVQRKLAQYGPDPNIASGRFLDYKK